MTSLQAEGTASVFSEAVREIAPHLFTDYTGSSGRRKSSSALRRKRRRHIRSLSMSCVHFRSPLRFEVDLATNELVEVNCVLLNKPTSDRRTFDGFIPEAYLPLISSVLAFAPIAYIKLLSATLSKTPYRLARMVVYLLNRYMAIKFILELQRLVTQIQALHGS